MKSFISWDDKYNTGHTTIDQHHKELVDLISRFDETRKQKNPAPLALNKILDEFCNYTHYHFRTEEEIMEKMNYSAIKEHQDLHGEFILKLYHVKTAYERDGKEIDDSFSLYLKNWLLGHIAIEDPKVVAELNSKK